jgi:hypothetical protein
MDAPKLRGTSRELCRQQDLSLRQVPEIVQSESDGARGDQSGRTSAPIMPHLVHTALPHKSRIAVSSGQRSASIVALWWQSPVEQ